MKKEIRVRGAFGLTSIGVGLFLAQWWFLGVLFGAIGIILLLVEYFLFPKESSKLADELKKPTLLSDVVKRPAFLRISKNGKIGNLQVHNNVMIGHGDFIDNEGSINSALIKDNFHIPFKK